MTPRIVWLASYPKSGNTWFRAVFAAWRSGGPVDLNKLRADGAGTIASARARIEAALGVPTSLMTDDEIDMLRPRVDEATLDWGDGEADPEDVAGSVLSERSGVILHKIHDALFRGPSGEMIVSLAATRGAIYIVRDPRDVVGSYANHNSISHERTVRLMSDSAAAMSTPSNRIANQVRQRLGSWSDHVRSWVDDAPFPVHVVRYEDCITDPVRTFSVALRFAGFQAEEDAVRAAVDLVRFDKLRAQEVDGGFRERPPGVTSFFRRGESGAWRDELEPELVASVEADHAQVMRRFGYLPSNEVV